MTTAQNTWTISVIIPHLSNLERLDALLCDLKIECEITSGVEVVLVDNASTDGSSEEAEKRHPWIRMIKLQRNYGYAGGCNRGIQRTRSRWILLLNDDVRLRKGCLQELLSVAESNDTIASVQPKILSLQQPDRFDYAGGAGGMIDRFGYPYALGRIGGDLEKDYGQYDQSREIFWASGTASLWRRATLDRIGLLDERYFAHQEEIDLAWRAWINGWRCLSAPKAVVLHFGGGTLSYQAWWKMFLNHRNSLITLAKNAQRRDLLYLLPVRFILDHGIGAAELLLGRYKRLPAVWLGWISFLRHYPLWIKQRKKIQELRVKNEDELEHVIYRGCILVEYLRGVRSALELAEHPVSYYIKSVKRNYDNQRTL